MTNYYEILGVPVTAGLQEIKAAFRRLAKQYHPDKVQHLGEKLKALANEEMKQINEAYEYLKEQYKN